MHRAMIMIELKENGVFLLCCYSHLHGVAVGLPVMEKEEKAWFAGRTIFKIPPAPTCRANANAICCWNQFLYTGRPSPNTIISLSLFTLQTSPPLSNNMPNNIPLSYIRRCNQSSTRIMLLHIVGLLLYWNSQFYQLIMWWWSSSYIVYTGPREILHTGPLQIALRGQDVKAHDHEKFSILGRCRPSW